MNIRILIIGIILTFQSFNAFTASFQYSLSSDKNKIELLKENKSKLKKTIKPRKKWRQHFSKHGEKYFFGGILGLTVIFTTLKLTQIIAWSWLWVLSPIWITILLLILIFIYVLIVFLTLPEKPKIESLPIE